MFIFTYIITSKSQNISRNTTSPGKAKCGPPLISRTANRIPMLTLTWGENVSFPCRGLGIFGGMELNFWFHLSNFMKHKSPKFNGKLNPTILLFYTVFFIRGSRSPKGTNSLRPIFLCTSRDPKIPRTNGSPRRKTHEKVDGCNGPTRLTESKCQSWPPPRWTWNILQKPLEIQYFEILRIWK